MVLKNLPLMLTLITTISVTNVNSMVVETASDLADNGPKIKVCDVSEVVQTSDKDTDSNSNKSNSPEQTGRTIMFASNNLSNSTNAKEAYKEFARRYPIPLLNWNNPEEAKARRLVLSQQFHSNCYVDRDVLSRLVDNVCAFEKLYNRYVNSANVTSLDTKDYIGALWQFPTWKNTLKLFCHLTRLGYICRLS